MLAILVSQPYKLPEYNPATLRAWRYRAWQLWQKSGYTLRCQGCGNEKISELQLHHKNKDETDCREQNLVCLCRKCHHKKHKTFNFEMGGN